MSNYLDISFKIHKSQDSFLSSIRMLNPLVPYAKHYRGKLLVFCASNKIWVKDQATSREEKEIKLFFVLKNEQYFLIF